MSHTEREKFKTMEQEKCKAETLAHIWEVSRNLGYFATELISRAAAHDKSKLEEPELSGFAAVTEKLGKLEYGSKEYNDNLAELKPILEHHYSRNRHHPQHWLNGVSDMTLVDLIEMFCDWAAGTKRNLNGNLRESIEINSSRFKMSPQLKAIFENTLREYVYSL